MVILTAVILGNGHFGVSLKTILSLIKIFSFCSRITIRITFYTLSNLTIMVFLFNDERIEVTLLFNIFISPTFCGSVMVRVGLTSVNH